MRLFCLEYLKDFNGTQAAIRAGYSENTAAEIASENLRKPQIRSEIDKQIDQTLNDNRTILKKKILDELESIAFHDVTKDIKIKTVEEEEPIYQDGYPTGETQTVKRQIIEFIDTDESENKKAIASMKMNDKGVLEIKYHDKNTALDKLGRYLTLFTDKVEHTGEVKTVISREDRQKRIDELEAKRKEIRGEE
jgi:phage terminase small subunit